MLNYLERLGAWIAKRFGAPINTSAAMLMAVYTILWGFWLINPFWTVFDQAPLYSWLSSVAPEWFWGGFAIIVGVTMAHGIIRHTYDSLIRGAFIGFIHWGIIMTGYFIGDWQNTGGLTTAMIMVYCGFIYLNLKVNHVKEQASPPIL
jgi:hypothetical protein